MEFILRHRRLDGSFVIERDGMPYHVALGDTLHPLVAAAAGSIVLPPEPVPVALDTVPREITFRQLILGLLGAGWLTEDQALAAAETRARPPQFDDVIATLAPQEQLAARITWATMTSAFRSDPLFAALIGAGKATPEQVDALFESASAL